MFRITLLLIATLALVLPARGQEQQEVEKVLSAAADHLARLERIRCMARINYEKLMSVRVINPLPERLKEHREKLKGTFDREVYFPLSTPLKSSAVADYVRIGAQFKLEVRPDKLDDWDFDGFWVYGRDDSGTWQYSEKYNGLQTNPHPSIFDPGPPMAMPNSLRIYLTDDWVDVFVRRDLLDAKLKAGEATKSHTAEWVFEQGKKYLIVSDAFVVHGSWMVNGELSGKRIVKYHEGLGWCPVELICEIDQEPFVRYALDWSRSAASTVDLRSVTGERFAPRRERAGNEPQVIDRTHFDIDPTTSAYGDAVTPDDLRFEFPETVNRTETSPPRAANPQQKEGHLGMLPGACLVLVAAVVLTRYVMIRRARGA